MDNELEQIKQATFDSLNHYYELLSKVGYRKQTEVDKLLIMTLITDIVEDSPPIDEKDYNALYKVWDCIASQSCIINWPSYSKYFGKKIINDNTRVRLVYNNIRLYNNQIRITQL